MLKIQNYSRLYGNADIKRRCFQCMCILGESLLPSNPYKTLGNGGNRLWCNLSADSIPKAKKKEASKIRESNITLDLTEEQSKAIINELNTRTLEQLINTKYIGKNKAEALVCYRDEHGPLKNVLELKNIKGFGKGFFNWLEDNGELPAIRKKFFRQHDILNSLITEEQKNNITNIVSIDIGLTNAAWVHMDREFNVLAWRQVYISKPKPYNPALLKPQVQAFVDSLPKTDAYIVELQSHRVGKHAVALLPFVIHLRIMEAMIHCLLQSPVIPLDPNFTSKFFTLPSGRGKKKKAAVGLVQSLFHERKETPIEEECEKFLKEKSGLEGSEVIVEALFKNPVSSSHLAGEPVSNSAFPGLKLQIKEELIEYFQSCKKKDDLSDCLLQALTFFNLLSEHEL